MIRLHYRLSPEHLKQLNYYLAIHDRKLQKRLLIIICSLEAFVIVASYIIFRLSLYTILTSVIGLILLVLLMPRIYWDMVFKRADHFVDDTKIVYSDIEAEIGETIRIKEKDRVIEIGFADIVDHGYTRDDHILFYRDGERIDTLIIPVDAFSEEELRSLHLRLEEEIHGKTRHP